MVDMYAIDEEHLTLDKAADKRQWQLSRLDNTTRVLAELVREEFEKGEPIQRLAKRAGVTRSTIYSWLQTH